MDGRTNRRLGLALLAAGLLASAAGLLLHEVDALRRAEQLTIDARFDIRGDQRPSPALAVVALDEQTYVRLPDPRLPRDLGARAVRRLAGAGARVVAYDLALESRRSRSGDLALARALEDAGRSVVSVTTVREDGAVEPLVGRIPFDRTTVRPGLTLLKTDSDGTVRGFPEPLAGIEPFALVAARLLEPGVSEPPADALIDFPGPAGTVEMLSLIDVIEGRFAPSDVRDRVVVIGPSAPVLQDRHPTAVDGVMPGPEIHAAAIATALDGYPLRRASARTTTATLIGLGLLVVVPIVAAAVGRRRRAGQGDPGLGTTGPGTTAIVATGAIGVLAWSAVAIVAFGDGVVLAYVAGLVTIGLATLVQGLLTARIARRELLDLRRRFAAAEPDVVDKVLGAPDEGARAVSRSRMVAGYRLQAHGQIGRGGMGAVYAATQQRLERRVALKVIHPDFADDQEYREQFVREAQAAAALVHHAIIPILDAGEDRRVLYIAMPYVEGGTLGDSLGADRTLPEATAIPLLHEIATALDFAHRHGIVHRDVKPSNVLLPNHDLSRPYLTDFGLARTVDLSQRLGDFDGWRSTPQYAAPEQEREGADHRVDVYALAAMLFRCLAGATPTEADGGPSGRARLSDFRPDLGPAIADVLERGLASAPGDRYGRPTDLTIAAAGALGLAVRGTVAAARHAPDNDDETPPRRSAATT